MKFWKLRKTAWKILIRKKCKQSENDEFEAFAIINNDKYFEIIKYYPPIIQMFWKKIARDESHYCPTDFTGKLF